MPFNMHFGRGPFWNDKGNRALVEGVMIRVIQFDDYFVRTRGKMLQDDWVPTRIGPNP